jgi:hypothetical protein
MYERHVDTCKNNSYSIKQRLCQYMQQTRWYMQNKFLFNIRNFISTCSRDMLIHVNKIPVHYNNSFSSTCIRDTCRYIVHVKKNPNPYNNSFRLIVHACCMFELIVMFVMILCSNWRTPLLILSFIDVDLEIR